MKRPLATLLTLVLVSSLLIGATAGPVAAQQCSSVATSTNVDASASSVDVDTNTQINVANIIQTGVAVSLGGDSSVVNVGDSDQSNDVEEC